MNDRQYLIKYLFMGKVLFCVMNGPTRDQALSKFTHTHFHDVQYLGSRRLNTQRNPGRFFDQD